MQSTSESRPATQERSPERGTLAEVVGDYVASVKFEDVPGPVIERAKALALDCVGLALVAGRTDLNQAGQRALRAMGGLGDGPCTIIGSGQRTTVRDAAFANGLLVGGLDWDDTHLEGAFHSSASAFPSSLAVAEEQGVSGPRFLLGYVTTLEVASRVAAAARDGIHQAGFAPTGVAAAFGSAAGAAQLLDATAEEVAWAQGIAGSFAAGLLEFLEGGTWTKNVHGAWGAHSGVTAAYLAAAGFNGPTTVYEGQFGLYRTHLRDSEAELRPEFFSTLGHEWEVLRIAVKEFPVCHFSQAFLTGLFELMGENDLARDDIAKVSCLVPERVIPTICEPYDRRVAPLNAHDAQESLPYVLAAAIVHGQFTEEQLNDTVVHDPEIQDLARRISYAPDPNTKFPDEYDGELTIETADGRKLTSRNAAGNLDYAAVEAKFRDNAERTVGAAAGKLIQDAVMSLEDCDDIRDFTALLGPSA